VKHAHALKFAVLLASGAVAAAFADGFREPPPPALPPLPGPLAIPYAPDVPELLGPETPAFSTHQAYELPPLPPGGLVQVSDPIPWLYAEDEDDYRRLWARVMMQGGYGPPWGSGGSGYTY
jgi:hypothetical protein